MTRTQLTSGNSTNDASQYTTDVIVPGAQQLILMFVVNFRPQFGGTPAVPTVTGNALTWQQVQTVVGGAGGNGRLTCFRSMAAAPGQGAITIDFADEIQDLCAWSVFQYDGVDTSGTAGGGAIAQSQSGTTTASSLTITLAASADPQRDTTTGGLLLELVNDVIQPITPGTGYTQIDEQTPHKLFGQGAALQTQDAPNSPPAISWSWEDNQSAVAIALEVKAAPLNPNPTPPPADPTEALVRRFEPILFLHPDEQYVPVDAKRYVENAALWAARTPFGDKNSWGGGTGDPFPRRPMVPAGQLSGLASEPGDYLGTPNFLLSDPTDERFLELGGWKDQNAAHEDQVTADSTNRYGDRTEIARLYSLALEPSRFWYHAELFDTARLSQLAPTVTAPDLTNILARFKNPALLCYYLLYPAHEQSVGTGEEECTNIEAKELACHAGDWQCAALLLEGDGTGAAESYTPRFFGLTGLRPVATDAKTNFRPYQFDDENRTVMKVEAWRAGTGIAAIQPEVIGDHPRFYVARGSHSLYTIPGMQDVSPYPDSDIPRQCGQFDTPAPVVVPPDYGPPPDFQQRNLLLTLLVKMVAGGAVGNLFGGFIAGIIEAIPSSTLIPLATPGADDPDADAAPTSSSASIAVRPSGLQIPDAGSVIEDWRSQQGLQIDGRTYDFLVDRSTQVWWPSDDQQNGYRGRWGQRVTADYSARRSGPTFPPYWKMFLMALADGDARGLLDLG